MAVARILTIDDEPSFIKFVSQNLRARGYETLESTVALDGLELARTYNPDLVMLDIGLPGMDGFEVCSYLRQFSNAAIIMVTARGDETDKIRALDMGADDYLTKPFGVGELMSRVRAVLRRYGKAATASPFHETFEADDLKVDFQHRRVTKNSEPVKLTPTEYALFEQFVTHPDVALTHRQLLSNVWGPEFRDDTEYLRVYVGRLRRKLEADPSRPRHLQTEGGIGYRFKP